MKITFLGTLFCCLLSASALADNSDLNVTVSGIKNNDGLIRLGLYRNDKTFAKEKKAVTVQEVQALAGEVKITVRDLPPGEYGVLVYHDSNASRSFNNLLGLFPREGFGLSNNPDPALGINFDASAFEVAGDGDVSMAIRLNYCQGEGNVSTARTLKCWLAVSE